MKKTGVIIIFLIVITIIWSINDQVFADENFTDLFTDIELAERNKSLDDRNPLITQRFGADPTGMVYDGRMYVFMTHDVLERDNEGEIKENTYGQIQTLNRISSEDLVNWTDHGTIQVAGSDGKAPWADLSWAPDAGYKSDDEQDEFFLYFSNNASGVGVLKSDNPVGPYTDPLGEPLISRDTENTEEIVWLFDPAVFVDDGGIPYLYFGGGVPEGEAERPNTARVVELKEDMITLAGTPEVIEAPYHFESSNINKIGDTYYYSYSTNFESRQGAEGEHTPSGGAIAYMTSDNPMGPWEYQDVILENPGSFFGTGGNNHQNLIKFNDQWYILYHAQVLQDEMGIAGGYRSTHIDRVEITDDGEIKPIVATRQGVDQVKSLDPYQINEAETMAWSGGIKVKQTDEPSEKFGQINTVVTDMSTGSFIGVSGVNFGQEGAKKFTAKVASEIEGSVIKITIDDPEGEAIGYLKVPETEDSDNFVEESVQVENITGEHDLFFVFAGEEFNFDSWNFQK